MTSSTTILDLPQPDFQLLSTEIAKVANIPAIQEGNLILLELRELRRHSEATSRWQRQADAKFEEINTKLDLLGAYISATNKNGLARIHNATTVKLDFKLSPLVTNANESVSTFPADLNALRALSSNAISELLELYDLPAGGTITEKKKRFKNFVGVSNDVGV